MCYVGITRAKKHLYLLNTRHRTLFGKSSSNIPSRFIGEISSDLIESNIVENKTIKTGEMYESGRNDDLNVGDRVRHERYGDGVVVKIDGSLATIAFGFKDGIKQLAKNHKSLKKIEL